MNRDQLIGLGLCSCLAGYMYMETMGKVEPKQYHEAHSANNLGFVSFIGSASYASTASTAGPFILGTSTLGSNDRLG